MDKARETLVERRPTNEILAAHLPELLSPEEKLIWLLGDLMNAAENFFGYENPKRLGHINSSAIRILDEIVDPLRADLTHLNAKVEEQAAEIERLKITISAANSAIKMLGGALEKADRADTARLVEIADLSACLARAVEVRALVWDEAPVPPCGEWLASSPVGLYCIPLGTGGIMLSLRDKLPLGEYSSIDRAKAAAQADFEQRIRSALVLSEQENPHG